MTMTIDDLFNYANEIDIDYKISDGQMGGYIPSQQKAWVDVTLPEDLQVETFVHELLHHHYCVMGYNVPEGHVEAEAKEFYEEHRLLCHKLKSSVMDGERYTTIEDID